MGNGVLIFGIEAGGSGAIGKNGLNGAEGEQGCKVGGCDIADRSVTTAMNLTSGDHVPKGYAVGVAKGSLFLDGRGNWFVKKGWQNVPKAVLRVAVEERSLTGLDRWKTPQDQDARRVLRVS